MDEYAAEPGRTLNPYLLGSLNDDPAAEHEGGDLFPGERRFLSAGAVRKRRALLDSLKGVLDPLLGEDEQVLYLLPAQQNPSFLEVVGLGWSFIHMHRVALVLTDQRLIEILMDLRGTKPSTRIRSYPWAGVSKLKFGLGKLTVTTIAGKKQLWRTATRADRKLLKGLVSKIQTLMSKLRGTLLPEDAHYWSCPSCSAQVAPNPETCDGCGTRFRTAKSATWLALAFPGGGLFYAQRPILGALDLLGELFLFGLFAVWLAVSSSFVETMVWAGFGAFFFLLTKAESVHVSRIMVRRARAVSESATAGWRKFGWGGAAASVVALALAGAATGSLAATLARDLDFEAEEQGWIVSRAAEEFYANEDGDQRSQWYNLETGLTVVVFGYVLDPFTEFAMFRDDYVGYFTGKGVRPVVYDDNLPAGLAGFRCFLPPDPRIGTEAMVLNYMLLDEESDAIHHVMASCDNPDCQDVKAELEALLETAAWIPAADLGP